MQDGSCIVLSDGKAGNFSIKQVTDSEGAHYNEAIAYDVTELREKQKLLLDANDAKIQTINALKQIQNNVISITREEEILSLKMKLHHELGYNLQTIRKFFQNLCPEDEKELVYKSQKMLSYAVRECLTNTIKHAQGNKVFVNISYATNALIAELTHSGAVIPLLTSGGIVGTIVYTNKLN